MAATKTVQQAGSDFSNRCERRNRGRRAVGMRRFLVPVVALVAALVGVNAWRDQPGSLHQPTATPRPVTGVENSDWRHIGHDRGCVEAEPLLEQ